MSQDTFGFSSPDVFELARLNRMLAHLARPALSEVWQAPLTETQLIELDLFPSGPPPRRKELIERLWRRKRHLQRKADAFAQSGPDRPVA